MANHTPGPWRYVRANPSPTTGAHLIAGAKPGYLAEVRDCGSGDVSANAALIAAAPDMLAALKLWAAYQDAIDSDDPATSRPLSAYSDAMDATYAAIAKAGAA